MGSAASAWGGRLRSRRVWEVMGPMEIRRISCGRVRPEASSNARRFVAVELLVNVIAAGQFSRDGEELAEGGDGVGGDDVAVDGGDGDVGSGGAEGVGEVLAGGFGAEEEEAGGGSVGLEGVGEEGFGEGFGYGLAGGGGWGGGWRLRGLGRWRCRWRRCGGWGAGLPRSQKRDLGHPVSWGC